MQVVAESDWVIDMGPGAGDEGGAIVAEGPPQDMARSPRSVTAPYLAAYLAERPAVKVGPAHSRTRPA